MNLLPSELIIFIIDCINCKDTLFILCHVNNFFNKHILLDNKTDLIKTLIENAAANGRLEILIWTWENGYFPGREVCVYGHAAQNNHLEILKWAKKNNCEWNSTAFREITSNIQYGSNYNFSYSDISLHGKFEIARWLRENPCEWDYWHEHACSRAASNGYLEILKWLRENGCKWDKNVCIKAAENNHLRILKWAKENGCPLTREVRLIAESKGYSEILDWAVVNGCP